MTDSLNQYPSQTDEEARLETLRNYEILDSPEEPQFDTLTKLAEEIFEVPIALVCLVDENRLWFKSVRGLDIRENERNNGFGDDVLLARDLVTIENTPEDERVSDNPLMVNDPDIRAYAGAPLRAGNDHILGTFCILDREPRSFTDRDQVLLSTLAHATMEQIHLRYCTETRRQINRKLRKNLNQYKDRLQQTKVEKDELLHRVKNNFSQVRSLLNQERSQVGDSVNIDALEAAETKIHCFVAVYKQLNQARYTESLSSRSYLSEITENASQVFENEVQDVSVTVNLEDRDVPSELILKFGIALNEFITNSYQHVFVPNKGDHLDVSFKLDADTFRLSVSDNGSGLPEHVISDSSGNGGLHLIRTMIQFEEGGTFQYQFDEGSTFTVELPASRETT